MPLRPPMRIHEYAPMKGGESNEMMMQISSAALPRTRKSVIQYASAVPITMASTVTQAVTLKLLIID